MNGEVGGVDTNSRVFYSLPGLEARGGGSSVIISMKPNSFSLELKHNAACKYYTSLVYIVSASSKQTFSHKR